MSFPRSTPRHRLRLVFVVLFAVFAAVTVSRAQSDPRVKADVRTISGTVTDAGHEPIRNAVVELENPTNHEVVSFITGADGHYVFQRLNSHTDFQIWATFRGQKSNVHNISMYDDHLDKIINIVCKTY